MRNIADSAILDGHMTFRAALGDRDVRAAVDLCHRDGSLKQTVAADPGKFMHEDPRLAPTLESLRASGRKVFLATNSLWDYTHVVMNFLICGAVHRLLLRYILPICDLLKTFAVARSLSRFDTTCFMCHHATCNLFCTSSTAM